MIGGTSPSTLPIALSPVSEQSFRSNDVISGSTISSVPVAA
jgi:hypothetical protein